jgi:hypothetical protein
MLALAAQIHWDVGASAGVMKRVLTGGAGDAGFGPAVSGQAHVALLPFVRVGAYVAHDISPVAGPAAARHITSAGLHLKIVSPVPRGDVRVWLGTGFGYAGVYAPSYHQTLALSHEGTPPFTPTDVGVHGAGGSYFEIPVSLGAGYMLRKERTWRSELTAELGARFGVGFTGSAYDGRFGFNPDYPQILIAPLGKDSVGLFLTVGINLEL